MPNGNSAHHRLAGPALIALLAALLTLGLAAQNPAGQAAGDLPEKVTVVEEVELLAGANSPNATYFYKRYSADTFTPQTSDMEYRYETGGCVQKVAADHGWMAHDLQLPEGARITYMRLYFYDIDPANDAVAQLMSYDGQGHLDRIDLVQSSGTPGWSSVGSGAPFSHPVHNVDEALAVWLVFGQSASPALRICGVRIQYEYTLAQTSLPLILNESNP